jgi:hypothetical protein
VGDKKGKKKSEGDLPALQYSDARTRPSDPAPRAGTRRGSATEGPSV